MRRAYLDQGIEALEAITWRHVPDPEPGWRMEARRWRKPKFTQTTLTAGPDLRGRPLPLWAKPPVGLVNRWVWYIASAPANDLTQVPEPVLDVEGTAHHDPRSPYWSIYTLPLRPGVVLL